MKESAHCRGLGDPGRRQSHRTSGVVSSARWASPSSATASQSCWRSWSRPLGSQSIRKANGHSAQGGARRPRAARRGEEFNRSRGRRSHRGLNSSPQRRRSWPASAVPFRVSSPCAPCSLVGHNITRGKRWVRLGLLAGFPAILSGLPGRNAPTSPAEMPRGAGG